MLVLAGSHNTGQGKRRQPAGKPRKQDRMTKSEKYGIIVVFTLSGLLLGLWIGVQVMQKTGPRLSVGDGTLIQRMQDTCAESYGVIDGPLEQKCGELQDQLQARGYETLSRGGKFWVEQ